MRAQLLLTGVRRALVAALAAAAAGVVLVGGFGIGSAMVQERLLSITQVADAPDRSVTDRYTMWAAAVDIWRDAPVTGVGLKGFPQYRDGHASLALSSGSETAGAGMGYQRQPLLSPHNMYLLILSEQGLLRLLALAGGGWPSRCARRDGCSPCAAGAGPASTAAWSPWDCSPGSSSTSCTRTSAAPPRC